VSPTAAFAYATAWMLLSVISAPLLGRTPSGPASPP
jgi:hypothetical protein